MDEELTDLMAWTREAMQQYEHWQGNSMPTNEAFYASRREEDYKRKDKVIKYLRELASEIEKRGA